MMDAHVERMMVERHQLTERLTALMNFIGLHPTFKELSKEEQDDMKDQQFFMIGYRDALERRIRRVQLKGQG